MVMKHFVCALEGCNNEFDRKIRPSDKERKRYCCKEHQNLAHRKTNEYIIHEDYAEIVIDSPKYGIIKTKIDLEDVELCKQHRWMAVKTGNTGDFYFEARGRENPKKYVRLHRLIMNCPDDKVIDHINTYDHLDNRKSNLRICTPLENAQNIKIPTTNKSGYKNVFWDERKQKFQAYLTRDKVLKHIGYYLTAEEANEAVQMEIQRYERKVKTRENAKNIQKIFGKINYRDKYLDKGIIPLLKEINKFKGLRTFGSCEGNSEKFKYCAYVTIGSFDLEIMNNFFKVCKDILWKEKYGGIVKWELYFHDNVGDYPLYKGYNDLLVVTMQTINKEETPQLIAELTQALHEYNSQGA